MNRKAELSFQVIVIAVLALLILVILSITLLGRFGIFNRTVGGTCADQGGVCARNDGGNSDTMCEGDTPIKIFAKGCSEDGASAGADEVGPCCLPLSTD